MPRSALLAFLLGLGALAPAAAQPFYRGNDLSYANQMEDCGAVFKEDGQPKDVYAVFADHGTNLVRVRLWVDPAWQNAIPQPPGVRDQYSDFADVREAIQRAKAAGMEVLLDFHYSDFWADPGRQVIPARWTSVAYDTPALADSVYQYTHGVLTALDAEGLMPELVQVGNETNSGMLIYAGMDGNYNGTNAVSWDWGRQAVLFNAAIAAVRAAGAASSIDPRIAVHFADPAGGRSRMQRMLDNGITDFDILGLSFYYAWHDRTIAEVGAYVRDLRTRFPAYDLMLLETGYLWSVLNYDGLGNIITAPDPAYLPVSPVTQLEYQVDLTREVMRAGGAGVVFWEPAWVSTPCRTPWGQGSSHDHVAFFDPYETDFIAEGGGRWTEAVFYADPEAPKTTFRVDMTGQDVSGGVFLGGGFPEGAGAPLPMVHEGSGVYRAAVYPSTGTAGGFFFLRGDTRETVPAACAGWNGTDRRFEIGDADAVYAFRWGSCEDITAGEDAPHAAAALILDAPRPHPVRSAAALSFTLPAASTVRLELFDILGRRVRVLLDGPLAAGAHEVSLSAADLPAGTYVCRLTAAGATATRRITVTP